MKTIKGLQLPLIVLLANLCILFNSCNGVSGSIKNFTGYQSGNSVVLTWDYTGDYQGMSFSLYRNGERADYWSYSLDTWGEGEQICIDNSPSGGPNITYRIEYENPDGYEVIATASTVVYYDENNSGNSGDNGNNNDNNNDNELSTPSNVYASLDGNSIKITWSSVSGASGYNVYRASSSNGYYEKIGDTYYTSYYDNSPIEGKNYYKIKAYNSSTESAYSSHAYCEFSKKEEVKKPSAPTGVTAEFAGSTANPQVYITWNEVENATSYKVYRATSANGYYSQIGYETDYTRLYDYEPRSGANYYKVKAINSAGESEYSSYAKCNYDANAYSPCPPTLTLRKSGSNLRLSWTVSTAQGCGKPTSYEVKVYEPSINDWWSKATLSANETSYTLPNYMLYSEDGYVKIGVLVTNDYGTASNVAVWDVKNDKQL